MPTRVVLKSHIMQGMPNKSVVNLTRLKELMNRKRWGLGELAEYSKVKYQTLYSLSVGRRSNTSSDTLRKIADALDTSTDYLLGETDDDTPPIQKLPVAIRQLAEVANQLSEVRQEELLRIGQALLQLEREQAKELLPNGAMYELIKLADQIREQNNGDDVLDSLRALLRKPPRGWFIDNLPRGQGPVNPSQND